MAKAMQDCVLLFGDSITQEVHVPGNLHQRMTQVYQRRLDVLNRAFGGYTSVGGRLLLDEILVKKGDKVDAPVIRLITIWFGTNDSVLPPKPQTVQLPTFIENINHILHSLTSPESPYAVSDTPVSIILITPGPCVTTMFEDYTVKWRTVENTRLFKDAILDIGRQYKGKQKEQDQSKRGWAIETVDFWEELVRDAGGEGEELRPYFSDGVHLTPKGYEVLWKAISATIQSKFRGRGLDWDDVEDLPRRVPPWVEVDWQKNPGKLLELLTWPKFRFKN